MSGERSAEYLRDLVRELCRLPREAEWLELKENKAEPQEIGEYLSALSNAAALAGKPRATPSGVCAMPITRSWARASIRSR